MRGTTNRRRPRAASALRGTMPARGSQTTSKVHRAPVVKHLWCMSQVARESDRKDYDASARVYAFCWHDWVRRVVRVVRWLLGMVVITMPKGSWHGEGERCANRQKKRFQVSLDEFIRQHSFSRPPLFRRRIFIFFHACIQDGPTTILILSWHHRRPCSALQVGRCGNDVPQDAPRAR